MSHTPWHLLQMRARQVSADSAAATVPSPCTSVCRMEPEHGWCAGCLRTLEEITAWSRQGEAGKREVWARLEQRSIWLQQQAQPAAPHPDPAPSHEVVTSAS